VIDKEFQPVDRDPDKLVIVATLIQVTLTASSVNPAKPVHQAEQRKDDDDPKDRRPLRLKANLSILQPVNTPPTGYRCHPHSAEGEQVDDGPRPPERPRCK